MKWTMGSAVFILLLSIGVMYASGAPLLYSCATGAIVLASVALLGVLLFVLLLLAVVWQAISEWLLGAAAIALLRASAWWKFRRR